MTAAAALLGLCACSGTFGERAHEDFHQSIDAGAAPSVTVDNIAGSVDVSAWPKSTIDVTARKYGYDTGELRNIAIDVSRNGSSVAIATRYNGGTHSGGVRYRISVPAGAAISITNIAGSVNVGAVSGDVSVETQAGTIDARLGRVDGTRSIDLRATTGSVRLQIARDSNATVGAQSTVGSFTSDFNGITQARENLVGSRASGAIGTGSARIRLTTTTGSIAIRTEQ